MIFWIAKIIAGAFGLDISKVQRWVAIGLVVLVIIAVLFLGLWARSCWNARKGRINQEQIVKNQQAIATKDREQLKEAFAESTAQEQGLYKHNASSKAEAINTINEAKKKADQMTNDELAAELERLAKEQ